jgi:hypothetical protein
MPLTVCVVRRILTGMKGAFDESHRKPMNTLDTLLYQLSKSFLIFAMLCCDPKPFNR